MFDNKRKKQFVDDLANLLSHHLGEKSMLIQQCATRPELPHATLVKEWGRLRTSSCITGWAGVEDTKETLCRHLFDRSYEELK